MRKLIKSNDGTLFRIAEDGLPTQLFCPVTSKSDDRCMDSCSWYHEMEYEGEATCYCQEHEIGVRLAGKEKSVSKVIIDKLLEDFQVDIVPSGKTGACVVTVTPLEPPTADSLETKYHFKCHWDFGQLTPATKEQIQKIDTKIVEELTIAPIVAKNAELQKRVEVLEMAVEHLRSWYVEDTEKKDEY